MKYYIYKLDLIFLNVMAIVVLGIMVVLTHFLTGNFDFITDVNLNYFLFLVGWLILHELLHGVGFLSLGKVKNKNVVLGAELEKGIFYCMCKQKISKLNILISLLYPLVLIGIVTYVIGLIMGNNLLIFLSIVNISGAVGDMVMTYDILVMPNDIMYLDLDDTTSFTILSKKDLNKKKYLGIELDGYGEYTDKIKAKDYTKFKISKGSVWFFIIFLILIIISIIDLLI